MKTIHHPAVPRKIEKRITLKQLEQLKREYTFRYDADLAKEFGLTRKQVQYAREKNNWLHTKPGMRQEAEAKAA